NERNNREVKLTNTALDYLTAHNWPGNVRELQNLIERLVILTDKQTIQPEALKIHMDRLPTPIQQMNESLVEPAEPLHPGHSSLKDLEQREIEASLRRNGWVQARAARELGLTQRQIGYRIKKFNLSRPAFAQAE
ncbi:AAA family ATPase, partial [Desulfotalea psychrophila]|nr:AAA family ATPase [Desulfotalea psychrophila]